MSILADFVQLATSAPRTPAVIQLERTGKGGLEETIALTYGDLLDRASRLATWLCSEFPPGVSVGLAMGNSSEWIVADLALLLAGMVETPVPLAFSADQASHLLSNCVIVLTDVPGSERFADWRADASCSLPLHVTVDLGGLDDVDPRPHLTQFHNDWICKVIHTSGTTSRPKGVQIRLHGLDALVNALWLRAEKPDFARYLSLVPFSLLIEQVTALYLPFTAGGAVLLPPASMPPLGAPGVTAEARLDLIRWARPSALTLTPALVEAIAGKARTIAGSRNDADAGSIIQGVFGQERPPFLAVGGAPINIRVLKELDRWGIPVFQGYGLSENGSVATWNYRGANRIGTVGKPLPHVEVKLTADRELCLRSPSLFAGYDGADPSSCDVDGDGWLHTGDLAEIDDDGYVSIIGRRKTLIITSNGRNISPEWLESRYRTVPGVAEVIVFGDDRQFLCGLFLIRKGESRETITRNIRTFSEKQLSEIERIPEPLLIPDSPVTRSRLFTVTGRPKRDAVEAFVRTLTNKDN